MGEGADGVAIGVVLWLVAVSVVMTAVGVWLARGHRLRSPWIALVWAVASIAPLVAAGGYLYLR
ncbi:MULTISPECIES: hypothetical protein [unclassified Sphingomonas]|uniref:hypothetical protein n=1 Tax=unclassified Sphingomonas TaxID=196159 RepID=UPI0025FD0817|nr:MULTISPECIES: hypothetical protein [unclassified Sphingomonas]